MSRYTTKDEDGHSVHSSDENSPIRKDDEIPPDLTLHMPGRQDTDKSSEKNKKNSNDTSESESSMSSKSITSTSEELDSAS